MTQLPKPGDLVWFPNHESSALTFEIALGEATLPARYHLKPSRTHMALLRWAGGFDATPIEFAEECEFRVMPAHERQSHAARSSALSNSQ